MYKVIEFLHDLTDDLHPYNAGDIFPRAGAEISESRIDELATDKNLRGRPLIVKVGRTKEAKPAEK